MIDVKQITEGTFNISWDENDPIESMLNTWEEKDFINFFTEKLLQMVDDNDVIEELKGDTK
jgi:hypothetical protein